MYDLRKINLNKRAYETAMYKYLYEIIISPKSIYNCFPIIHSD